mmetsp:Transcript_74363/g.206441  ORF Transcript_74363/g.206441 Transcript_74363/m.206441 type:complete len:150 (+) Transcript_74363:119-568(+)
MAAARASVATGNVFNLKASMYAENVLEAGHIAVWGSLWEPLPESGSLGAGRWGYACCRGWERRAPCPEAARRDEERAKLLRTEKRKALEVEKQRAREAKAARREADQKALEEQQKAFDGRAVPRIPLREAIQLLVKEGAIPPDRDDSSD